MTKTIVVVDKTGRGHSICAALVSTNPEARVHYVPGTGGVFENNILPAPDVTDADSIIAFCEEKRPDFVLVSHIDALIVGVADRLRAAGFAVFGASKEATQLESSKWFCKEICFERGIVTPAAVIVKERAELVMILADPSRRPFMVKADWLTLNGNGAISVREDDLAEDVLREVNLVLEQNPGAPFTFLVEDFLEGNDYSSHFFLNENSVVPLPSSQDFKNSHEEDRGVNCDGMGSLSPHPFENPLLNDRIRDSILEPMLEGLHARGVVYNGPIYLGLRLDANGVPHLLEINTRMGDSESQTIFPRVNEDLSLLIKRLAQGEAVNRPLSVRDETCMTITLASGPKRTLDDPLISKEQDWPYRNLGAGAIIRHFPKLQARGSTIYWANVEDGEDGNLQTRPGRVAHITAMGRTQLEAQRRIYASINSVCFSGKRWRTDIAVDGADGGKQSGNCK